MKYAVLLLMLIVLPAAAEEGGRLSLDAFLKEVRTANPEIAAAAAAAGAASARVRQAWLPMDPVLEFERMYSEGPLGSGAAESAVSLKQEFRNPFKYRLARSAAKEESSYYGGLSGDRASKVLAEAAEAFHGYLLLIRTERLYAENLELLRGFARAAESRYAAGRGSQSDALKAQVELSKGLNLLLTAGQEKETAAARLNALRNRPPGDQVPEPEEAEAKTAPADHRALESAALAGNPYLKAMKARLAVYDSRLSLAKAGYAPDFMLGWRRRSADNAAMDGTWDVSLGLTIPLWFGRNRAEAGEARAERGMALAEYEAARNTLLLDLKAAAVRLDYYARLVELYGGAVLPQAEQALKASQAEYAAGQGSFLDLIDSGRTLVETRREYFEYRAGYSAWQARIKAMIGESI